MVHFIILCLDILYVRYTSHHEKHVPTLYIGTQKTSNSKPTPCSVCMSAKESAPLGLQNIIHQRFCNFIAIICVCIVSVASIICTNGRRKSPKHGCGPSLLNAILCYQNWKPVCSFLHKLPMMPINNTLSILSPIHSKTKNYCIIHSRTSKL